MSEQQSPNSWTNQWLESQRSFWDAWSNLYQQSQAATGVTGPAGSWADALEYWWKAVAPMAKGDSSEFFNHLVRQSRSFMRFGEEIAGFLTKVGTPLQAGSAWQPLLRARIDEMKAAFSPGAAPEAAKAMRGLLPFFELPIDTWSRTFAGATPFPGDYLKGFKPEGLGDIAKQINAGLGKFLSIPGVGYSREWQEQAQIGAKLALDYEAALQAYLNAHGQLGADALELLYHKIVTRSEQGQDVKSLREIYDLWVDCAEEAYAKFVFTDDYADLYARLVNALMALKRHSQQVIDEVAGALNMPTQKGIKTMQCRQRELQREVLALKAALEKIEADPAKAQLSSLQADLSALDLKQLGMGLKQSVTLQKEVEGLKQELSKLRAEQTVATPASLPAAKPSRMRTAVAKKAKAPTRSSSRVKRS